MTAQTATLTDFLLARIAEDEAEARRWIARRKPWSGESFDVFTAGSEERVLAECEAKRRIVEMAWDHFGDADYAAGMESAKRQILDEMVQPYADHPDFREEWRA